MAHPYVADRFTWRRRQSRPVQVGPLTIGGTAPILVQSMCTTPTQDVDATVAQCIALAEAGCKLVRITAPGVKDAEALGPIRAGFSSAGFAHVPLCADIHFMPKAAMVAIEHVEKVRVNPGNFADKKRFAVHDYTDSEYAEELERVAERFRPLVLRAKELGRALRIGTNHGSLSDRIMNRFGDTPAGMVESAMEFVHTAEGENFYDLVISMKSSNPKVMVQAYRMLCARLAEHGEAYPLHLGVTEAGDGEDGRVKGAAGIGCLLEDGIGDTIRVSLTEDPIAEIPVAEALAKRYSPPPFAPEPMAWPPQEAVDPLSFSPRRADIIRLGGQPIGGGKAPLVLAQKQAPAEETQADLLLADPNLWGGAPKGTVGHRSDQYRAIQRPDPGRAPVLRIGENQTDFSGMDEAILLIDLAVDEPEAQLRRQLPRVPASSALGIGDAGGLGATRAYRLLAAVDEECFLAAEAKVPGSGIRHPIVLAMTQNRSLLGCASIAGGLLIDGIGDAIYLPNAEGPVHLAFTILQAVKARTTRTDYVACPSCGRTLFDLMEVTAHIKEATDHLVGVTIAIMGCIVNGPGEMADADFGFVGSGPGKVDLYSGKTKVRSGIPFAEAREGLIDLIKESGRWQDRSAPTA